MGEPRRTWQRPELTALVRGAPEEAMLSGCKTDSFYGPYLDWGGCYSPSSSCSGCEATVAS